MLLCVNLNAQNVTSDRLYTQVDHMPQITNCYTSNGNMYKIDRCTSTALKSWFLSQMEYPPDALKAKIEEKFLFLAIVDTLGILTEMRPTNEMTSDLAIEAHRLAHLLIDIKEPWMPGMQGKKKVKVQFEVLVEFKIADWNNEVLRRAKEAARQDSILKSNLKLDSIPKKGK